MTVAFIIAGMLLVIIAAAWIIRQARGAPSRDFLDDDWWRGA